MLMDTQVFLWAAGIGGELSESASRLLVEQDGPIFLSAVSAWEIAIKWSKGRLDLPEPPDEIIRNVVAAAGLSQLAITSKDAVLVADLPLHHKDPFDRLLIAQARSHGLRLMTYDPMMEKYDVDVIALWLDDDE
jgi:PIN domain nuclease of toxin-antitoxin system